MLTGFWSWLAGFVIIKLSGGGQERFLNLALQRGIEIWDVNWQEADLLEVKAAWQDLKELRRIAKVCGCKLNLGRGRGLPFTLRYLKGRKTLAAGMVLFVLGLLALSELVFTVNVLPQEELHELDISRVQALATELGVKPGAIYRRLDIDGICARLQAEIPELSWVYIERSGTVVNIEVAERSIYPDELENATRGAIWANRDALIEDVLIKHGQAVAQHGDTVQEGDLLVSPLADGRADAIIHARVWYQGYGECALTEEVCEPLGSPAWLYTLTRPDGAELRLWGKEPELTAADQRLATASTTYRINLGQAALTLRRDCLQPQTVSQRELSEEEAKAAAYQAAITTIYAQQNPASKLLNEDVDYALLENGVWSVNVTWECLEEIGVHTTAAE